ncbi:hypothetical protein AB1Y20_013721 [Prymnesium parvum]|uniref:Uncharacterized protein n=1 Tax=Prymnesium parvum TaxID=97485 RepID=A0AB34IIK6_PRYPA
MIGFDEPREDVEAGLLSPKKRRISPRAREDLACVGLILVSGVFGLIFGDLLWSMVNKPMEMKRAHNEGKAGLLSFFAFGDSSATPDDLFPPSAAIATSSARTFPSTISEPPPTSFTRIPASTITEPAATTISTSIPTAPSPSQSVSSTSPLAISKAPSPFPPPTPTVTITTTVTTTAIGAPPAPSIPVAPSPLRASPALPLPSPPECAAFPSAKTPSSFAPPSSPAIAFLAAGSRPVYDKGIRAVCRPGEGQTCSQRKVQLLHHDGRAVRLLPGWHILCVNGADVGYVHAVVQRYTSSWQVDARLNALIARDFSVVSGELFCRAVLKVWRKVFLTCGSAARPAHAPRTIPFTRTPCLERHRIRKVGDALASP